MKPCIAVVQYRPLEELPPVMTLLSILVRLGWHVHYIGVASKSGRQFLEANQIPHTFLFRPQRMKVLRLATFLPRRWQLLRILGRLEKSYGKVIPWFQECHSAALAGDSVRRFGRAVTTFFEYECNYGARWLGFDLDRMLKENVIVECEVNRARMTQMNHNLKECPLVIANKAEFDFAKIPPLSNEAKAVFDKIGSRPVFLYQGYVSGDRKDLPFILETIARHRPNYCVLSLPGSDALNRILASYSNAFTLSRIPAPGHLAVTAKASVGIAVYNAKGEGPWADNARFCAPNKIYEYAAFGVPTLGNRIPGLESTIGKTKAGLLCDMTEESILSAADELIQNISKYRENARTLYRDTDVVAQINAVLARVWDGSRAARNDGI